VTGLSGNPPFALPISASSATNSITAENPSSAVAAPASARQPSTQLQQLLCSDWI